jgi:hypothetical protein
LRAETVAIALGVLAGTVELLEGTRLLTGLLARLGLDWDDPEYHAFAVIASGTDALPIGPERQLWATEALARHEPDLERARTWATPIALPACQHLVSRFGPAQSQ